MTWGYLLALIGPMAVVAAVAVVLFTQVILETRARRRDTREREVRDERRRRETVVESVISHRRSERERANRTEDPPS